MPRQRSVGRAPSRPTASAPAPQPQQPRPATTMAAPPAAAAAAAAPPPPQVVHAAPVSQGPGLFGQMASTAAGVAIGSSVGHAITGLFSGGSSEPAPAPAAAPPVQAQAAQDQPWNNNNCASAAQSFTKCLDDNGGNMQICNWYLEQLKACQAASQQ